MKQSSASILARALRGFFTDHLPRICGMSPHTCQSYRDAAVLLLRFIAREKACSVTALTLDEITPNGILAFLQHLESERGNATSTRNVRLSAIHSFFRYIGAQYPEYLDLSQRILAIPFKRSSSSAVEYLEYHEIEALLAAIDRRIPYGRRDYALLATLFNTGARVQETLNLCTSDLQLCKPFQIRFLGKGRKERLCPIWPQTALILRELCSERGLAMRSAIRIFTNHRGEPLTRFGVRYILNKHLQRARQTTPSLATKRLHPHCLRHSTAVHLLKAGVDLATISHWLGHASLDTTQKYAVLDLEMKRQALAKTESLTQDSDEPAPWRKEPSILEWLESL